MCEMSEVPAGQTILAADGSLSLKVKSCGSDHVITEARRHSSAHISDVDPYFRAWLEPRAESQSLAEPRLVLSWDEFVFPSTRKPGR